MENLKASPAAFTRHWLTGPRWLGNFLNFYASMGRALDHKLFEAVYLRTSLINGCHYCTQHHIHPASVAD